MPHSFSPARAATAGILCLLVGACAPALRDVPTPGIATAAMPAQFTAPTSAGASDGGTATERRWQVFFAEPELQALITSALAENQELKILLEEIEISRNEARARSGEYLPSVRGRVGGGVEKAGRYTRDGAVEHGVELRPGEEFPEPLPDLAAAAEISWEVDIWGRLRNSTKAAMLRYLATAEGRRFAETHLVAEVAKSYYELVALDRRIDFIQQTIAIQANALEAVRLQRAAGQANELAVRRFEGELQGNRTRLAITRQEVVQVQNRLNFLLGRYPAPIARSTAAFAQPSLPRISAGAPSELLSSRPDVRRAELELQAAGLDVKAARARFLPGIGVMGALGVRSVEASSLLELPASLAYGIAADLTMPLLNRRELNATARAANARQVQALQAYRQTVLAAFLEVETQFARIHNLDSGYVAKTGQVAALRESIALADQLFRSARSDYLEVLLVQREALEAQMELVELRQQQLDARISAFQALGGGASAVK